MRIDPKHSDGDGSASGGVVAPVDPEADAQTLSDLDQTGADADQTGSDLDQTTSDADQSASERDQRASDRDQEAANSDEAISDHVDDDERAQGYARSRRARSQATLERDQASRERSENARIRDEIAGGRDRVAEERDKLAEARDRLAARLDAELERLDLDSQPPDGEPVSGMNVLLRAAGDRKRAAAIRARAAAQREAAARDREEAALDRQQAALDRAAAAEELELEGFDYLTGAMRRRVGLAAIQRELDRTARNGEPLVVAFVDVDGLKAVNDELGHGAGDELLRETVNAIKARLRSYDVIVRFGGDEFVCSLAGQDATRARERFDRISLRLAQGKTCGSLTVGLAERRDKDSVDELIERADEAMRQRQLRPAR